MKKIILVLACAFGALALNAQTEKVVFGKMPKSAQEFVQTYFAKENVQDVELNRDDKSEKYSVSFANGNQVVFDNSGDWTEINMKVGPVPANVVSGEALQRNRSVLRQGWQYSEDKRLNRL